MTTLKKQYYRTLSFVKETIATASSVYRFLSSLMVVGLIALFWYLLCYGSISFFCKKAKERYELLYSAKLDLYKKYTRVKRLHAKKELYMKGVERYAPITARVYGGLSKQSAYYLTSLSSLSLDCYKGPFCFRLNETLSVVLCTLEVSGSYGNTLFFLRSVEEFDKRVVCIDCSCRTQEKALVSIFTFGWIEGNV